MAVAHTWGEIIDCLLVYLKHFYTNLQLKGLLEQQTYCQCPWLGPSTLRQTQRYSKKYDIRGRRIGEERRQKLLDWKQTLEMACDWKWNFFKANVSI